MVADARAAARPSVTAAAGRMQRVLVRCPNWLGDTVMAIPTLRALRAAWPAAELWCLGPWVPPLLEAEPGIDHRLAVPRGGSARRALVRQLRRASLDLALLLPNSFGSALLAWRAGARARVGYAGDGRSCLLTHRVPPPPDRVHQVAAYLALLAPLGLRPAVTPPTLTVAPPRRAEARRLLATLEAEPGRRVVGIQLGAALGPSKLWPPDRVAALATGLGQEGVTVLLLGGPDAAPLLTAVERAMPGPVRSVVGRDHPALLPALLAELAVLVTSDSGPAHVAAAVGTPAVVLFGPTDPRLGAPLGSGHAVFWARPPCAPCYRPRCPIDHRCMTGIAVAEVLDAVLARLAPPGGSGLVREGA